MYLSPTNEQELAEALKAAADAREIISLGGAHSKDRMGGRLTQPAQRTITTSAMKRVLNYEPRDLTISVEAGLPWREFRALLAANQQMVPLDPPYADTATVGGVVAANTCGPRRRLYGSARDLVIGMRFATLEGKVVQTGGMVVKNVAGLDMSKLMIGSFGTLAALASVNFKLNPVPVESLTFVLPFADAATCLGARDQILQSVLQPAALDLLNPAAAARIGLERTHTLLLEAGGNAGVLARYIAELGVPADFDWMQIHEFTPRFAAEHPGGTVIRVSHTFSELADVLARTDEPVVARAGNGVSYVHFAGAPQPLPDSWRYVAEYGGPLSSGVFGSEFAIMEKVKDLFDPQRILNPGRLYGRL